MALQRLKGINRSNTSAIAFYHRFIEATRFSQRLPTVERRIVDVGVEQLQGNV